MAEVQRDTIVVMRRRLSHGDGRPDEESSRGRRIGKPALLGACAAAVVLLSASPRLHAEGKTAFLTDQLKNNTDFRVRTSAALSLGTSDDADAVKPLCGCLDSQSETESVRVACAAALGKLKKPGTDKCLKDHTNDSSAKVKEQVATSLKALGGGSAGGVTVGSCPNAPAGGDKQKYYVGVTVQNKSSRPDTEIKPLVEKQVVCKFVSMSRFRIAPLEDHDPKKMSATIAKDKLDGYYLSVSVDPIKYDSGSLKVSMKMVIMTHTRDIKGELGKSLTMPGVTSPSKSDEDDLLKAAAEKLVNDFAGLKQ
jgi:hypothetical protein